MNSLTRKCYKCGEIKTICDFSKTHGGAISYLCKSCSNKKSKEWRDNNEEKKKASNDNWKKKNAKRIYEYSVIYKKRRPDVSRRSDKKYRDNNKDKMRAKDRNRRAKETNGKITKEEWDSVLAKYGNKCLRCGKTDVKLTMDHVIPLFWGGLHVVENVQPLCVSCNSSKHIKAIDYREQK